MNEEEIRNCNDSELLSQIVLDASKRLIELKCNDEIKGIILAAPLVYLDNEPTALKVFKVTIES